MHAVIGLPVFVEQEQVGKVVGVHPSGPIDMLEVRRTSGGRAYVPCLKTHLLSVDLDAGRLTVASGALAEVD